MNLRPCILTIVMQYIKQLGREMTPLVLIAPRFIEGYVREVSMVTGVPLHYQYHHNNVISSSEHALKYELNYVSAMV